MFKTNRVVQLFPPKYTVLSDEKDYMWQLTLTKIFWNLEINILINKKADRDPHYYNVLGFILICIKI